MAATRNATAKLAVNRVFPWEQVSEFLDAVMELPAGDRVRYLETACPDAELRNHLENMILSYDDTTSFMEKPPVLRELPQAKPWFGRRIGPYQLVEELGEGGMGIVYRALRADDHYLKSTAIKLMKGDFSSNFSIMRFRVERQILASLDHPNIARLLDGGSTEEGTPYLVMELIEGQPIDEYCDAHRLSIADRLKLFRQACAALQYAHQHLVIHRDLKPKNILVTDKGDVKLLDFGIAKILDPESFPQVVEPTSPLLRMLSPEYASPEQIQGEQIATASDVYSLGVVLYELLTGHRPYSIGSASFAELTTAICHTEPVRPSAVIYREREILTPAGLSKTITPEAISEVREGNPNRLRHRLAGDLDNIVLKALRKDPARRYGTPEQMSEDLRRHLEGLPVSARPDTLAYRTEKFVKRHKTLVSTTLLVMVCLIVALSFSLHEAQIARRQTAQAERRLHDVRDLVRTNLVDVHSAIEHLPGSATARNIAIQRSLKYLDEMNNEVQNDLQLTREVSDAYEKIADLQGAYVGAGIGDSKAAQISYRKALELRTKVLTIAGNDLDDVAKRLNVQRKYTRCLILNGEIARAYELAKTALADAIDLANRRPNDRDAATGLGMAHLWLATACAGVGSSSSIRQIDEAIEHDREHAKIFEQLASSEQVSQDILRRSELMLASHLSKARQFEQSKRVLDRAIAAGEKHQGANSADLSDFYNTLGLMYEREGQQQNALVEYKKSWPIAREVVSADPQDLDAQLSLQIAEAHVGMQAVRLDRDRSGLKRVSNAIETVERLNRADPSHRFYQALLVVGYAYRAEALSLLGDQKGSLSEYRRASSLAETLADSNHADMESRLSMAKLHIAVGVIQCRNLRYAEARSEFQSAQSSLRDIISMRPSDAESIFYLSQVQTYTRMLGGCKVHVCPAARGFALPSLLN